MGERKKPWDVAFELGGERGPGGGVVIWYDLEWVYNDFAGGFLRGTYLMWLASGLLLFFYDEVDVFFLLLFLCFLGIHDDILPWCPSG